MTNYSIEPNHVRAELFKASTGKWYMTVELVMPSSGYDNYDSKEEVRKALLEQGTDPENWFVVVPDPYSKYGAPLLLIPKSVRLSMGLSW